MFRSGALSGSLADTSFDESGAGMMTQKFDSRIADDVVKCRSKVAEVL